MYEGWPHTGFSVTAGMSLTGSWQAFELVENKELGANKVSRVAVKFNYIAVDLTTIAASPNTPTGIECMLTWDEDGDHYVFSNTFTGSIKIGQTTATKGTVVIDIPSNYNAQIPPKSTITANAADKADRSAKVYLWVRLTGGTTPTANGLARVGFHHGGV